ncbi:MAG: Flp pilus assembly protein CpaB [Rhodanobacter sp.]
MERRIPAVNRNVLYLGGAIVLGIVASLMAVHYINNQVAARTRTTPTETRQVVVPVRDLDKGASISQDDIAVREVPAEFVPADALTPDNYEDYLGQVLRVPLTQGAPIGGSAVDRVTDHFSNVIEPGKVAYSIQVDESSSVSGLIVPGDHLDILLLLDGEGSEQIRPLLGDVPVLATGKRAKGYRSDQPEGDDGSYSNITLGLAPNDAQRLGMAMKVGELRVMLRPAGNRQPFDLKTLSKADLLRLGRPVHGNGIQFIIGGNS